MSSSSTKLALSDDLKNWATIDQLPRNRHDNSAANVLSVKIFCVFRDRELRGSDKEQATDDEGFAHILIHRPQKS